MKAFGAAFALSLAFSAFGQEAQRATLGAEIYERNCSACHGARMLDPQGAFDLRKFPRTERERFINSVTKGKNQMPPWGDLLKPEEIEALWLYVVSGAPG
ncbi:MAG TPA: cytochrome c [Burkholderiales bacterium]|jgi:mono/diheme cytochrome c family protein|nr:cytochrome c [Burkholderiales bacterium]